MVIGRVNGVLNDTVLLKLVVYFLGFALFIDDFFFFEYPLQKEGSLPKEIKIKMHLKPIKGNAY